MSGPSRLWLPQLRKNSVIWLHHMCTCWAYCSVTNNMCFTSKGISCQAHLQEDLFSDWKVIAWSLCKLCAPHTKYMLLHAALPHVTWPHPSARWKTADRYLLLDGSSSTFFFLHHSVKSFFYSFLIEHGKNTQPLKQLLWLLWPIKWKCHHFSLFL